MNYYTARLENGIQLGYANFGKPDGIPAFYFHGLPGSAAEGELFHDACYKNNIELFSVERPGYGESKFLDDTSSNINTRPQYRFSIWAQSLALLADDLKIDRFYVFAVSGGGPYALACASLLGDRVIAAGISCGLGPVENDDLKNQMRPMATSSFYLASHHPVFLTVVIGNLVQVAAKWFSRKTIEILAKINLPVDQVALMQSAANEIMQRTLTRAFIHGSKGAKADLLAAQTHWSFSLEKIKNLHLWHGDVDRVVPISHSEWVHEHINGSILHTVKGEGHFSLPICHAQEIVKKTVTDR